MWKSGDFVPLPSWLDERKKTVNQKQDEAKFTSQGQEFSISYQRVDPESLDQGVSVLLLHGMRFSAQTWVDLGTMQTLGALGYTAVAVDLPGYGKSKDQKPLSDTAVFLRDFIGALNLDRPVIVSPSMSGSYSLPFLLGSSPNDWESKARGFVPVAPIFTDQFTADVYKQCKIPTLVVQGSKDVPMGSTASQHLGALPNSFLHVMDGAGHPCYLDNPAEWHHILYNFLKFIEK